MTFSRGGKLNEPFLYQGIIIRCILESVALGDKLKEVRMNIKVRGIEVRLHNSRYMLFTMMVIIILLCIIPSTVKSLAEANYIVIIPPKEVRRSLALGNR